MTTGFVWILLLCLCIQNVISESPAEQLQALNTKFVNQPDCTPEFQIRHPGYISPNATAHPSITTEDECRSSCIKDENCMSYIIDPRPEETFCRIQTSYPLENNFDGPIGEPDVKEYVFTVKCVNSTDNGQCAPLIEVLFRNWNTHGALEQRSAKSEMECRALCLDDQDCMSYQIDSRQGHPLCYIQKDLQMPKQQQMYMEREVTEYFVVDRCLDKYEVTSIKGCFPVFKKINEDVSKLAAPYPFVTTEQLCRTTCLFKPDCLSYQINKSPEATFCQIQTNGGNLKAEERSKVDLVTEYILVDSCTEEPLEKTDSDCKPFIIPKPYPAVSLGAESHAEVTNLEDCRLMCVATPTCVAFQKASSSSVSCWIQKNWMQLLPSQGYLNANVREYVAIRKCSKGNTRSNSEAIPIAKGGPTKGGPISSNTATKSEETPQSSASIVGEPL